MVKPMADFLWMDDGDLLPIANRKPSTPWGNELFRAAWPQRFPTILSSDTYRGYASVLARIFQSMRNGITVSEIERTIDLVDSVVKTLEPGTAFAGGAGLAVVNQWQDAHAINVNLFPAKLESELIYTARTFVTARQLELGGRKLA
jgi:hypothetical protein